MKLLLSSEVAAKIRYWTEAGKGEVSGLGTMEPTPAGYLVTDVFLPKQECSSSSAKLDQNSVGELIEKLFAEGKDTGSLKFHWHSHDDMQCFWSTTDMATIERFGRGGMLLSLVTNKQGETLARFDLFSPVRIEIDNIPLIVLPDTHEELRVGCFKEVREKVTEEISFYQRGMGYGGRGTYGQYNPHRTFDNMMSRGDFLEEEVSNFEFPEGCHRTVELDGEEEDKYEGFEGITEPNEEDVVILERIVDRKKEGPPFGTVEDANHSMRENQLDVEVYEVWLKIIEEEQDAWDALIAREYDIENYEAIYASLCHHYNQWIAD